MGLAEDFAKFLSGSNRIIKDTLVEAKEKIANMTPEEKAELKKKLDKENKFLEEGMDAQKISTAIGKLGSGKNKNPKKEGQGLKEGKGTDFGMLSVEAGIDNNPKPTQADRIAGATKNEKKKAKGGVRTAIAKIKKAKDGARTGVRGTGAAKRGFRKAKLSQEVT